MDLLETLSPKQFFKEYDLNRLGELYLRDDVSGKIATTERSYPLEKLAFASLGGHTSFLDSNDIESIVLFGSSVTEAPYMHKEGSLLWSLKIPFIKNPINYMGADEIVHADLIRIDMCVITKSYVANLHPPKQERIYFSPIDFGPTIGFEGHLNISWTNKDAFVSDSNANSHLIKSLDSEGISLCDSGFFKEVQKKRNSSYVLNWSRIDEHAYFLSSEPSRMNVLQGKLLYTGEIPILEGEK